MSGSARTAVLAAIAAIAVGGSRTGAITLEEVEARLLASDGADRAELAVGGRPSFGPIAGPPHPLLRVRSLAGDQDARVYGVGLVQDLELEGARPNGRAKTVRDRSSLAWSEKARQASLAEARRAFFLLRAAVREALIADEEVAAMSAVLGATIAARHAGEVSDVALDVVTLELAAAGRRREDAAMEVRLSSLALGAYLGVADETLLANGELPGAVTVTLDVLLPMALDRRPEIAIAEAEAERAREMEALATRGWRPHARLSALLERGDDPDEHGLGYEVALELDVPWPALVAARRSRASEVRLAAEGKIVEARLAVERELREALLTLERARARLEETEHVDRRASDTLPVVVQAVGAHAMPLGEIRDTVQELFEARRARLRAEESYALAAVALDFAAGHDVAFARR